MAAIIGRLGGDNRAMAPNYLPTVAQQSGNFHVKPCEKVFSGDIKPERKVSKNDFRYSPVPSMSEIFLQLQFRVFLEIVV